MSKPVNSYRFQPTLFPTLLTVVLLALLLSLGFWQLERARQKEVLLASMAQGAQGGELPLEMLTGGVDGVEFRPASGRGEYDLAHQFLLDNRIRNGQPGYHVLTPLRLEGTDRAVLVNRGWVALGADRATMPALPGTSGLQVVRGVVRTPGRVMTLGDPQPEPGWPRRLQDIQLEREADALGYRLLPVLLLLDPAEPDGFIREWEQPLPSGPERNRGYAVQWFALAAALFVIYVVVNVRRKQHD